MSEMTFYTLACARCGSSRDVQYAGRFAITVQHMCIDGAGNSWQITLEEIA